MYMLCGKLLSKPMTLDELDVRFGHFTWLALVIRTQSRDQSSFWINGAKCLLQKMYVNYEVFKHSALLQIDIQSTCCIYDIY